jgi:hypothetical protein
MGPPVPCRRLRRLLLREPRVHPRVDLAADPVQERLDDRVPVGRPQLVVGFCSRPDLLGGQRRTHADTIYRCRAAVTGASGRWQAWSHRHPVGVAAAWQTLRSARASSRAFPSTRAHTRGRLRRAREWARRYCDDDRPRGARRYPALACPAQIALISIVAGGIATSTLAAHSVSVRNRIGDGAAECAMPLRAASGFTPARRAAAGPQRVRWDRSLGWQALVRSWRRMPCTSRRAAVRPCRSRRRAARCALGRSGDRARRWHRAGGGTGVFVSQRLRRLNSSGFHTAR